MNDPITMLASVHESTPAMLRGIEAEPWTDSDLRAPSLLPGWTRGHVLTHIARNADGIARALSGALRGKIVARYPGGRAGRDADIEAGSGRDFDEFAADVRESADRLDRVLAELADAEGWDLPTDDRPARGYVDARWREVEIHRVDLAGKYTADDWPAAFVSYLLPELADDVAERCAGALRIEVSPQGSVVPELGGRVWTVGTGETRTVAGPDWALLAWLTGRPAAASGALDEVPDLRAWL